ncbi:MAG: hypothetical protein J7L51_00470 [Desulfurococcales archaeon]|nr:hypothetical protein [Desulfurococcales archaeon]
MIKTEWDVSKLRKLMNQMKFARRRCGWDNEVLKHHAGIVREVIRGYWDMIKELVQTHILEYNPKKHLIDTWAIYVSPEANKIIARTLPLGDYLDLSPSVKPELATNEVWIDETQVLKPKES